jgi:DNA-binding transcriptional MerR regulator
MSIGDVLGHLRPDFADVTISKLRFLESEGLVEPHRTSAGYRKYSRADVARLRYILSAQRDHYLPLRVIREHLDAIDRGAAPAIGRPALVSVPAPSAGEADADPGTFDAGTSVDRWLSRADLLARSGADDDLLGDLERHGLVTSSDGYFPAETVEIVTAAAALSEFGLQARHLRAYRAAADREVGLFTQLVAPLARGSGPAARDRAAETVRELSTLTQRLHAAMVRLGLSEFLAR